MEAKVDCLECIATQALRAARIATDDPELQRRILETALARVPGMDLRESPAVLSMVCYEAAAAVSGKTDPYAALKQAQNAQALALEPELRRYVLGSPDPLETALHLSAAGNVIDLGTQHAQHIDIEAAVRQVLEERFAVDHVAALRDALADCQDLLFFLDNAGEIVFDKILIEQLLSHTRVTSVVKARPMINDATMDDAIQVGLTDVCNVIDSGGAFIGCPLTLISPAFRRRMDGADVIIGKGQANYETLDSYPGDVFLILKAKCRVVARAHGGRVRASGPDLNAAA